MDESEFVRICALPAYPAPLACLSHVSTATASNASADAPALSVSEETFAVIQRQVEHRRLRSELRLHRQDKTLRKYLARLGDLSASADSGRESGAEAASDGVNSGAKKKKSRAKTAATRESLVEIALSANFSPCMLARVLLEAKYGWSKTTIGNVFKEALAADDGIARTDPTSDKAIGAEAHCRGLSAREYAQVLREVRCCWGGSDISTGESDTSISISPTVLTATLQVKECIDCDLHCSPLADRIRHNMGVEYEYVLLETLRNRRLVFESEDVLREKGLAKTPDVRLLLPLGVRDPRSGELRVVNWIDSKAMFGDRHTHESENAGQVCSSRCTGMWRLFLRWRQR